MRVKKLLVSALLSAVLAISSIVPAIGAGWQVDDIGYWWQNDDGSYPVSCWEWLDGNKDGIAECYYFDDQGYMLANTITPDGYMVNADGQYVINVVQTKVVTPTITPNDNYVSTTTTASALPTSSDDLVWLSATGYKFHSIPNCGHMDPHKARQVTYDEAIARGFIACDKCY